MSRTDKTRPFWVKVCESASNYREVHNHASRLLRDDKGNYVREEVPGETLWNGAPKTRIVVVPFTECDLPSSPWPDNGHYDACHWMYTREFMSRGEARCGCRVCSQDDWFRSENRRDRRDAKRYTRNWDKEY